MFATSSEISGSRALILHGSYTRGQATTTTTTTTTRSEMTKLPINADREFQQRTRYESSARARARAAGAGVLSRRVATDDYTDARNVATVSRSSTSSPLLIAVVRRELCVARRAESPADLRRDTPHASHRARVSRTRVSRRSYGANYPRHFVVTTTST